MSYCSENVGVDQYATHIIEFTGTKAVDGMFCYWSDTIGGELFLFVFFGIAFAGILLFSESVTYTVVLAVLVSVLVLPFIPGIGVSFFQAVLALIITGGVLLLLRRLERNTN